MWKDFQCFNFNVVACTDFDNMVILSRSLLCKLSADSNSSHLAQHNLVFAINATCNILHVALRVKA
jgi:hypothetical protein